MIKMQGKDTDVERGGGRLYNTSRRNVLKGAGVAAGTAVSYSAGVGTVAAEDTGDDELNYSEDPWEGDAPWVEDPVAPDVRLEEEEPIQELFDADAESDDDDDEYVNRSQVTAGGAAVGMLGGPKTALAGGALGYTLSTGANAVSDYLYGRFGSGDEVEVSVYQHLETIGEKHSDIFRESFGIIDLRETAALSDAHFNAMVAERKGEAQSFAESKSLTSVQDWVTLIQSNALVDFDSFAIQVAYLHQYLVESDDSDQIVFVDDNTYGSSGDDLVGVVPVNIELVNGEYHEGYALELGNDMLVHPYLMPTGHSWSPGMQPTGSGESYLWHLVDGPDGFILDPDETGGGAADFTVDVQETAGNEMFHPDPGHVIDEVTNYDEVWTDQSRFNWSLYFHDEIHQLYGELRDEASNIVSAVYDAGDDPDIENVIPPGVYINHVAQDSAATGNIAYAEALANMFGLDHQPGAAMTIDVHNPEGVVAGADDAYGEYEGAQLIADWRPDGADTFVTGETYVVPDDVTTFVVDADSDMLGVQPGAELTIVKNLDADGEEVDHWEPVGGNQVARDTEDLVGMVAGWIEQQERVQADDGSPGGFLADASLRDFGVIGAVLIVLYGLAQGAGRGATSRDR